MVMYLVEAALLFLVIAGSSTIVWGVRRFHLSTRLLALTFAITAASWFMLLVTIISSTVRLLVLPHA